MTLKLGVTDIDKALASLPRVFVNSEPCEFIGEVRGDGYSGHDLLCYSIPAEVCKCFVCPYVITSEALRIEYIEVYVSP